MVRASGSPNNLRHILLLSRSFHYHASQLYPPLVEDLSKISPTVQLGVWILSK